MDKGIDVEEKNREESVKIALYFGGEEIPLENITSVLETKPAISRKKGEWYAENGFSCDEWIFELKEFKKVNCPEIEEVFRKFIGIFGQKTDSIRNICRDYNCRVSVIVVIHMENSTRPDISMSPDTLSFLHKINAELIVNIWGYDTEEDEIYDISNMDIQNLEE